MNCSCSMGALDAWFQVEVLGEGSNQEVGFVSVEIEERYFGLIVAQHGLHVLVVKVVVNTIHQIRIVDFNSDTHKLYNLYYKVNKLFSESKDTENKRAKQILSAIFNIN